jgi:hypothetical protein
LLGHAEQERAEFWRTKNWPARKLEAPEGPLGLSLSSLPSLEFLRGYAAALPQPRWRGRKSERDKHIALTIECLKKTGGRTEEARNLYVMRSPAVQRDAASRQFSRSMETLQTIWNSD